MTESRQRGLQLIGMAANSTFAGVHAVILLYLLVCGPGGGLVDADEGTDYLDRKESYVRSIADSAKQNQENCGTLSYGLSFSLEYCTEPTLGEYE